MNFDVVECHVVGADDGIVYFVDCGGRGYLLCVLSIGISIVVGSLLRASEVQLATADGIEQNG